jgi:hypothetical protein
MRTATTIVGKQASKALSPLRCEIVFGCDMQVPLRDIPSRYPAGDDNVAERESIQVTVAREYDAAGLDRVGKIADTVVEVHVIR